MKLYGSFKLIQEREYIENFNHNLEELFTNAIEESSKNIENIPMGDRFVMDNIVFDNSLKDDATYLKLSDLVREKAGVKQSNSQIDVIKNEIIPKYILNSKECGIITPYKNQVEALRRQLLRII